MRMASEEAARLLKQFYLLQQERVETYKLFDQGHEAYLSGAPSYNFPMYRQLVHEVTQAFKKISDEIISIDHRLEVEHGKIEVADFIKKIQEDEKTKLELTAKLQLAKQNMLDNPDEESHQVEVEELKQRLRNTVERINEHLDELKYEAEDLLQL
ncbi:hypothetical protein LSH36_1377g00006 [Paralvinella palmiformis]|uniref:Required for excision 1-B domain-containing protein n=1 Tax=Paralvinella palmiformis TaxID=53620 RepID=A0AAD9IU35_9ANNE|nr:hypothetical protein LSH36_1377g00006 [Paralvinella palmiformis]